MTTRRRVSWNGRTSICSLLPTRSSTRLARERRNQRTPGSSRRSSAAHAVGRKAAAGRAPPTPPARAAARGARTGRRRRGTQLGRRSRSRARASVTSGERPARYDRDEACPSIPRSSVVRSSDVLPGGHRTDGSGRDLAVARRAQRRERRLGGDRQPALQARRRQLVRRKPPPPPLQVGEDVVALTMLLSPVAPPGPP